MSLRYPRLRSLKTRVTLFTLAIFLGSIWSLSIYISRMLREDVMRQLGEHQFSAASYMAAEVGDQLKIRFDALGLIARDIDSSLLRRPADLQTSAEQRPLYQHLFNAGIFVTGADGTAIAEYPRIGRIGLNYMDRDHVAAALTNGEATIGKPNVGKRVRAPSFGMTVPIRDARGKVIGAVSGATDLSKPNFLDRLTQGAYGTSGYFVLVSSKHRLIVTSSDKRRIMEQLPPPGVNPGLDRIMQGYEGANVRANALGVEVVSATKGIPGSDWNIGVTLPVAEAFGPVHAMQRHMLLATVFLTLLSGTLTWWMLRRELRPLFSTLKQLAMLSDSDKPPQPLTVARNDEIGELIGGFNRLLEALARREQALKDSEEALRFSEEQMSTTQQISGTGSWVFDLATDKIWGSAESLRIFGHPPVAREISIVEFEACVPECDRVRRAFIALIGEGQNYNLEYTINPADGSPPRVLHSIARLETDAQGRPLRVLGFIQDITERHRMEEQVRQLAFYDPLTNLPNRRLLGDRLRQAMASSRRGNWYGALMFLDLDNFKSVNDTHGHAAGDLLLIEAANRLRSCVRGIDSLARLGGDEFMVVLGDLGSHKAESAARAENVANKIRTALSAPYLLKIERAPCGEAMVEHRCTVSIGVALFDHHEASEDDIVRRADAAMYQAKDCGRNAIRFVSIVRDPARPGGIGLAFATEGVEDDARRE